MVLPEMKTKTRGYFNRQHNANRPPRPSSCVCHNAYMIGLKLYIHRGGFLGLRGLWCHPVQDISFIFSLFQKDQSDLNSSGSTQQKDLWTIEVTALTKCFSIPSVYKVTQVNSIVYISYPPRTLCGNSSTSIVHYWKQMYRPTQNVMMTKCKTQIAKYKKTQRVTSVLREIVTAVIVDHIISSSRKLKQSTLFLFF